MTNQGPLWIAVRIGADPGGYIARRTEAGNYQTASHARTWGDAVEMAAALNDREDLRSVHADG